MGYWKTWLYATGNINTRYARTLDIDSISGVSEFLAASGGFEGLAFRSVTTSCVVII